MSSKMIWNLRITNDPDCLVILLVSLTFISFVVIFLTFIFKLIEFYTVHCTSEKLVSPVFYLSHYYISCLYHH